MEEKIQYGLKYIFVEWVLFGIGIIAILFLVWIFIYKKTQFLLCVRNVFRNKRRSFLTLLAIAVAVSGNLLMGTYFMTMFEGLREFSTIRSQTGHMAIMKTGYFEKGSGSPGEYIIEDLAEIVSVLEAHQEFMSYTELITSQLSFAGLISVGEKSLSFVGTATEAQADKILSAGNIYVAGASLSEKEPDGITLGFGLATQMKAKKGDRVTLISSLIGGGITAADATIRGVFKPFAKAYSDVAIKTNLQFAQDMVYTQGANKIVVLLHETKNTTAAQKIVQGLIDKNPQWGVQVYDWYQLQDVYKEVVGYFSSIFTVISVLLFCLTVFLVLNTIAISVFERFNEFGTMRAIGVRKAQLVSMILTEGVILGIIGAIVGIIFSYVIAYIIVVLKVEVPPPPGQTLGYLLNIVPLVHLEGLKLMAISSFSVIGVTLMAAFVPGLKAAKLKIIDSLRFN